MIDPKAKGYRGEMAVKSRKAGSVIYSYLDQAEKDSKNTPKIPLVLYKTNNKKFLVIADAEFILPILAGHK